MIPHVFISNCLTENIQEGAIHCQLKDAIKKPKQDCFGFLVIDSLHH